MTEEWSVAKKWNPFNSYKLLSQVYKWRQIKEGNKIPQPTLVTIDPVNRCNLNCSWCNANKILKDNQNSMSKKVLLEIADFLKDWQGSSAWEKGVEAVCIAGGGEPLLNPNIGEFINKCVKNGIEVGVVTNGTLMHNFISELSKCTWVGVSIDAGFEDTYERIKGANMYSKVIQNINILNKFSKKHIHIMLYFSFIIFSSNPWINGRETRLSICRNLIWIVLL